MSVRVAWCVHSVCTQQQRNSRLRGHSTTLALHLVVLADERQLPLFPGGGGGLFGGLMGGLVNQAVKGLASQLEKAAQETRDVSEEAAARIRGSAQIQQRLGSGVTVGPAMSQSVSSSSINGRTTKTVTLLLPVYSAGGVPVAQAQVTQTQSSGQGSSCRVAVSGCAWGTAYVLAAVGSRWGCAAVAEASFNPTGCTPSCCCRCACPRATRWCWMMTSRAVAAGARAATRRGMWWRLSSST